MLKRMYELARFCEREGLEVISQAAIITAASTLYPFMREKIEQVFQCRVFNRYGSREVGDIACERPGCEGLWVAPWGNYVEIVDSEGNRVPDGAEGEILVTSLINFAMPLVRYSIGDRGVLSPMGTSDQCMYGQVLKAVLGRSNDMFRDKDGTLVDPGYFMSLCTKDWVRKFQVVQKSASHILFRIVRSDLHYRQTELDEISTQTRLVMGDDCKVTFEFVDEIPPSASGKYRYAFSEVQAHEDQVSEMLLQSLIRAPGALRFVLVSLAVTAIAAAAASGLVYESTYAPLVAGVAIAVTALLIAWLRKPVWALYAALFVVMLPGGLLPATIQSNLNRGLTVIAFSVWLVSVLARRRPITWTITASFMCGFVVWGVVTLLWADNLSAGFNSYPGVHSAAGLVSCPGGQPDPERREPRWADEDPGDQRLGADSGRPRHTRLGRLHVRIAISDSGNERE